MKSRATDKTGTNEKRAYEDYPATGKVIEAISEFSSSFWKDVRPSVRYQAIYKNKNAYRISFLCDFFEVSRSGYYKWLKSKGRLNKEISC